MLCVYPSTCTDFSNNGLGAVSPLSCTVTETLNGEYELTLEHPLDAQGKWQKLVEGNILGSSRISMESFSNQPVSCTKHTDAAKETSDEEMQTAPALPFFIAVLLLA